MAVNSTGMTKPQEQALDPCTTNTKASFYTPVSPFNGKPLIQVSTNEPQPESLVLHIKNIMLEFQNQPVKATKTHTPVRNDLEKANSGNVAASASVMHQSERMCVGFEWLTVGLISNSSYVIAKLEVMGLWFGLLRTVPWSTITMNAYPISFLKLAEHKSVWVSLISNCVPDQIKRLERHDFQSVSLVLHCEALGVRNLRLFAQ